MTRQAVERLDTLQAGRAGAAIAVVLFHLNFAIFDKPKYFPGELFRPFQMGDVGVQFFFALSGFLMTWLYAGRIGEPGVAKRFLVKRVVRIYPAFLVVAIPLTLVALIAPGSRDGTLPLGTLLAGAVLLPTPVEPLLGVSWTLQFEMLFYLVFTGLLAFPRIFKPLIAIWALIALARHFTPTPVFPISFFTDQWILIFLYGMAAAVIARRGVSHPFLWLALGTIVLVTFEALHDFRDAPRWLSRNGTGLGAAAMIIGLVCAERAGRIRVPQWMTYLGDISYALYLVHFPVLSVVARIMVKLGLNETLPRPVAALILFAATFVGAILLHEIVEKRVMRWRPRRSGPNLGVDEDAAPPSGPAQTSAA